MAATAAGATTRAGLTRLHVALLSLVLAGAAGAGTIAVVSTSALGHAASKPEVATAAALKQRSHRLDAWKASLDRALAARPPALPALPRYAHVVLARGGASGALPRPTDPGRRTVVTRVTRQRRETVARPAPVATRPVHETEHEDVAVAAPSPAPIAATAQPAPVAASKPVATSPESGTRSAEQQCEALKQAAEGQGEAAKQAAERQCEALKQAGED